MQPSLTGACQDGRVHKGGAGGCWPSLTRLRSAQQLRHLGVSGASRQAPVRQPHGPACLTRRQARWTPGSCAGPRAIWTARPGVGNGRAPLIGLQPVPRGCQPALSLPLLLGGGFQAEAPPGNFSTPRMGGQAPPTSRVELVLIFPHPAPVRTPPSWIPLEGGTASCSSDDASAHLTTCPMDFSGVKTGNSVPADLVHQRVRRKSSHHMPIRVLSPPGGQVPPASESLLALVTGSGRAQRQRQH